MVSPPGIMRRKAENHRAKSLLGTNGASAERAGTPVELSAFAVTAIHLHHLLFRADGRGGRKSSGVPAALERRRLQTPAQTERGNADVRSLSSKPVLEDPERVAYIASIARAEAQQI